MVTIKNPRRTEDQILHSAAGLRILREAASSNKALQPAVPEGTAAELMVGALLNRGKWKSRRETRKLESPLLCEGKPAKTGRHRAIGGV